MKKFLYKLMDYRFIYRLMPKWMKFIYSFDIMIKNKVGSLYLDNGYWLNFETMKIEAVDCVDCSLWKKGREDGTCIHYINNDCPCGYHDKDYRVICGEDLTKEIKDD